MDRDEYSLDNGTGSCENYSIETFNDKFVSYNTSQFRINNLFVLNFNIRSFNSNIDQFSNFIDELVIKPQIIILSETWFSRNSKGNINGYTGFDCCRPDRVGGGISIFLLNSMETDNVLCEVVCEPEIELVHIILSFNNNQIKEQIEIVAIYRPPETSHVDSFIHKLDSLLCNINRNNKVIIAGDLNLCAIKQDTNYNKLSDLLNTYSFTLHVLIPTRPNTQGTNSLIDHIWSNFGPNPEAGVFDDVKITDHHINFVFLPVKIGNRNIKIKFRNHSDECIELMISKLINFSMFFPLLTANKDFNGKFNTFYDELDRIYKKSCPILTKTIPENKAKKPWINHEIKLKIKRKHYLYQRYKNGALPYSEFQQFQSDLSKVLKKAKKNYYRNKYKSCNNNSAKTWKVTNDILCNDKKTKNRTYAITHNDNTLTDDNTISNLFNEYFTNVSNNLSNGIPISNTNPLTYMGNPVNNTFVFFKTTTTEVISILKGFKNKKSTLNNIPITVLKKISHVIAPLLTELFNDSIRQGLFPDILKIGRVIPIHKSGSRKEMKNYRPITTLSVFSKIFEKLVHKRLIKFITKYNLLNKNQFGFLKNRNTSDAILEFLDNLYDSLNNDEYHLAIYLDFSKAFDTISHEILMSKLFHMGFRSDLNGDIYSWLRSYLSNRKQYVSINETNSNTLPTNIGIPQGSTLGPLLFILYINDMANSLSYTKIIHFADDSTLYKSYNKTTDISHQINTELEAINNWLTANKLYLNVNKTKYMIINNRGRPPDLNLTIGNSTIERCTEHKFLGVYIDERLTFGTHTNKISNRIARGIGVLRRMKHIVPNDVLRQLFYAFIYSNYTYAITTYGSAYQNQLQRLTNLTNKAIKIITNVNRITPDVCKREQIFDFQLSYRYFCSIKMFQIIQLNLHEYFAEKLSSQQITHNHTTRASTSQNLTTPHYRYNKCQKSFLYQGTKIWNEIPTTIRNSETLHVFKKNLKKFLLS